MGFSGDSVVKNPPTNSGDSGSFPESGRSPEKEMATHSSILPSSFLKDFPGGSACKKIHLQCGRPGFYPWVGKIPWRRERLPTPVFWPGEYNGLHRPWGCKKSNTNEQFSLSGILAWEISGTDEPGGLQSMRSQRVG